MNRRTIYYAYANNLGYLVCHNKEVIDYDDTTDNAEEFKSYADAYDMVKSGFADEIITVEVTYKQVSNSLQRTKRQHFAKVINPHA